VLIALQLLLGFQTTSTPNLPGILFFLFVGIQKFVERGPTRKQHDFLAFITRCSVSSSCSQIHNIFWSSQTV